MHSKFIVALCGQTVPPERVRRLVESMDAEAEAVSTSLREACRAYSRIDLVLMDDSSPQAVSASEIERIFAECGIAEAPSLLAVVSKPKLREFRKPARVACDFAVEGAGDDELKLRIHQLLWPGEATGDADFVQVGAMSINLATYQVKVNGAPVDLTFMEYALLSFLVTHPGRIYSREVLLSQVWGFDYYGGSRTVDVHVRRLRAKLGPEAAQHLETVRGAGYLWSN